MAKQLVSGRTYRARDLKQALAPSLMLVDTGRDNPAVARARAIVALYLAEFSASDSGAADRDSALLTAQRAVGDALIQNPYDSILWLNDYLLQIAASGFASEHAVLLDQSYAMGPREGWIAISRNRRALAILPFLNPSSQQLAVSEFAALVNAGLSEVAQASLTGAGWIYRERLLASLEKVDLPAREAFARTLWDSGVSVQVPGVSIPDQPWRRN
ncbi:hypothetical protein [Bradyrhizobium guangzhouense]|uniref:hypothetical protein n=1 Tax=Bradyrhizobium guangzhouense TaxID=1325095 RepID=UPI001008CBCC|nr:hypothetical protein [Bradyrhizobium guangzhouense]